MHERREDAGAPGVERIDDRRAADVRVLEHLASLGSDPSEPHAVRHFFYVGRRSDADAVALALTRNGWETRVEGDAAAWLVVASHRHPLSRELVERTRARFEALAAEHRAQYDGWEADR